MKHERALWITLWAMLALTPIAWVIAITLLALGL